MTSYTPHPYSEIFPFAGKDDFPALTRDIGEKGLLEPITIYEGQILDGRNRYAACTNAQVEPRFVEYEGKDPLGFVVSKNLARRHLDESQRAMVGARIANIKNGGDRRSDQSANLQSEKTSQSDAAKKVRVSPRSIANARKVIDSNNQELILAVDQGDIAVSVAAKIADLPLIKQQKVISDERPDQAMKKVARADKEIKLANKQTALPEQKFGVIYADPEWKFETYSENGMDRSADNHYPTSALGVIKERDVKSIAADDCVLYIWATAPMMPQALEVMAAWGFKYKSQAVWVKDKIGTGYWFRNQHELLLVGTRGAPPAPAMGGQFPSIINAPVGKHSEKPVEAYKIIEAYFPNLPKIELNARSLREGWTSWGLETPEKAA